MRQLGIGQIGAGLWGNVMLSVWAPRADVKLRAICDANGDRAKQVAAAVGAEAHYDNIDDFLRHPGLDAVGVATPDFAHREATVKALLAGKDVLVQKPMATTVADCRAMVEAERQSGRSLMVDFQHRWAIGFQEARFAIEAGRLGKLVHGRIGMSNTTRVPTEMLAWAGRSSCLWFLGTHTADLCRYLIGQEVKSVFASSSRGVLEGLGVTTPDFFHSTLLFEDGVSMQMENSWILPKSHVGGIEMGLTLYGSTGAVHVNSSPNNVIVLSHDAGEELPGTSRSQVMARGKSIGYFTDCVLAGRKPAITGHDGLMNTAILIAIERSIAEGRVVSLAEVLA